METQHPSEVVVWDRTHKREVVMPSHRAAHAIMGGYVDLVGPHALPLDKRAVAGGPTAGDGHGYAWIRSKFAPDVVTKMRLVDAQRVIANGLAVYVDAKGTPIVRPTVAPVIVEKEPALISQEPALPLQAAARPSLLQRAARFAETIF